MVDVKRGILKGHTSYEERPMVRLISIKEAFIVVRTVRGPEWRFHFALVHSSGFDANDMSKKKKSMERACRAGRLGPVSTGNLANADWIFLHGQSLGQALTGMPAPLTPSAAITTAEPGHDDATISPRSAKVKMGEEIGGLGGEGSCGSVVIFAFKNKHLSNLLFAEDKKELIRAVARNAGGGRMGRRSVADFEDDDDDDDDDIALLRRKQGRSIYIPSHGPPGCGKTFTAKQSPVP
jgi:hypothetical protein